MTKLSIERFATKFIKAINENKFVIGKNTMMCKDPNRIPCLDGSKPLNVKCLIELVDLFVYKKFINPSFAHIEECKQVVLNTNGKFGKLRQARYDVMGYYCDSDADEDELHYSYDEYFHRDMDLESTLNALVRDAICILILDRVR